MRLPDKQRIRQRFLRSQWTYERHGYVQRQVADHLLALLCCYHPRPTTVLEIGCCTGILTRRLVRRFPTMALLTINDLVPELVARVYAACSRQERPLIIPLPGDIESIALPRKYDLIISSSTFHWLHRLEAFFKRVGAHLGAEGLLAFSCYGPENLREIREITQIGLHYPTLPGLVAMLERDFVILTMQEATQTLVFAHPQEVLHHLRATGVNALDPRPWSHRQLRRFIRTYQAAFARRDGVILTYHPLYVIARKR